MSFLLNEEQRQLSDSAIEFLAAQSPLSLQRQLRDSRAELGFEPTLWQQVVELGWPAAVFPESEGGLAVGYMGLGAIFEAMGRSVAALPLLSSVVLCGELVLRAGTESQRQALLPVLMDGTQRMALAMWAYADADVADIARSMELERNAAHQLLHRAKAALRQQLQEHTP